MKQDKLDKIRELTANFDTQKEIAAKLGMHPTTVCRMQGLIFDGTKSYKTVRVEYATKRKAEGATYQQIADEMRVTRDTVGSYFRNPEQRAEEAVISDKQDTAIRLMTLNLYSQCEIAAAVGLAACSVSKRQFKIFGHSRAGHLLRVKYAKKRKAEGAKIPQIAHEMRVSSNTVHNYLK